MLGGLALAVAGCGSDSPAGAGGSGSDGPPVGGRASVFEICGTNEEVRDRALIAFFEAREGDVIEFCEGTFNLDTGLIIHGRRGVTIRGQGMRDTVLNFKGSDSAEGLNVSNSDGIVIEGLSVEDTPGNGIRVFRSRFVTMRDVRVSWSDAAGRFEDEPGYTPREENGAYALYPVETEHVLIEDCEAHGASDAGVYVGQSNDVIVRRCLATFNVAGYEFENTYRSIFEHNEAYDNTGGFLVFDLPGLRQYGESNIVRNNITCRNNTDNFAPVGNIVGLVPRGTGMLVLSADVVDIHDNLICDNDTTGIAIVNFGLVNPNESDMKFDFFPEGVQIHNNTFRDNGGNPQLPDPDRGEASALPLLMVLKNMLSLPQIGTSTHILWDGGVDEPNQCDEVPVDSDGVPLTEPNPNPSDARLEARTDRRGRPNLQRSDPEPSCRWNAWKFDDNGQLRPENRLYLRDNVFENTRPETQLVTDFFNARFVTSELPDLVFDLLRPGSNDPSPYIGTRPLVAESPELQLPFVPDPDRGEARPDPAEVSRLCGSGDPGAINREALATVNCPRLEQYGLFADAQDPFSEPRGRTVPFGLSTALFTDYALKTRAIHLPEGTQIGYRDSVSDGPITNRGVTATLDFPVGTVISKTFSYRLDGEETELETRLLIKRETATGINWIGLPYVWTGEGAQRRAELKIEGARLAASYDYLDPDPDVNTRYSGSVTDYAVPAALNCITCHGGDNRASGAAPIGPKVRLLNSDFSYPDGTRMNQLQFMVQQGFLDASLQQAMEAERLPRWNVPGDTGHLPNSARDVHERARAYLETNCMHCHQPEGNAANSSLFLDSFRTVNRSYGICKPPVAAGRGSGGLRWVIVPGKAAESILYFRAASTEPGVRMPPIARTVNDNEAVDLLRRWIDDALPQIGEVENDFCSNPLGEIIGGGAGGDALAPIIDILPFP